MAIDRSVPSSLLLSLKPDHHHADASSIIRYLPGFEGPLPFELETGYIGVSDAEEDQLFYYFIKSENNPKTDSLLVWLTGGPGCSSFSGLVYENVKNLLRPLAFKVETYNGSIPSLVSTAYSWTKVKHFLLLASPTQEIHLLSDTGSVKRVDEFIRKTIPNLITEQHPEYSSNPFYVTGNSYSGKVIPAIVQEMSKGNCLCCKPQINLQGYVLGNPVTDFDLDNNTRVPFVHGMALISDDLYESMKISCGEKYVNVDPLNTECLKLIEEFKQSVSRIYDELVLDTNCDTTSPDCYTYRGLQRNGNVVIITCSASKTLKAAYHTILVTALQAIDLSSSAAITIYMSIPFVSTRAWIKSLNYSVIDKWRPWMILDKVAGYTTTYANKMTFATVKGGGHTLEYKPEENTIMFKRWISGQPL
ncbi:hypothetical protein Bca4012_090972 [Brassica carinata]